MPSPVRVAIVNDYAVVVAGVAGMLRPYADEIEVVQRVSGEEVTADADVVLYDTFGQVQGAALDVPRLLPHPRAKLVVYSWNLNAQLVEATMQAGAAGYLSKGLDGAGLKDALLRVHAGDLVTPQNAPQPDGEGMGRWPGHDAGLSPREAEVLALLCQGLSNQDIADRAYLGVNTVKTYLRTLFRKIGVESRTQAVLWGIDHGFRPDQVRRDG